MSSKNLLITTCILGLGCSVVFYVNSPERVAVHFGADGVANGWASKEWNLLSEIILYLFMTGLFLGLPILIRKIPPRFINLPNREYWLALEKRDATIIAITDLLYEFGTVLNVLFLCLAFFSFKASLHQEVATGIIIVDVVMAVYLILWMVKFVKRFRIEIGKEKRSECF